MTTATKKKAKKTEGAAKAAAETKAKLDDVRDQAEQAGAKAEASAQNAGNLGGGQPFTGVGGDKMAAVGAACWLMSQMTTHKHLFMTDIDWLVTPPVALGQFRLWHKEGIPVAYASWAYLNEDAEARLRDGGRKLAPVDWNSGKTLWLMDILAPFGGNDEIVKELREKVFPGQRIKTLQPAPDGSGLAVVEW